MDELIDELVELCQTFYLSGEHDPRYGHRPDGQYKLVLEIIRRLRQYQMRSFKD